MPTKPRYTKPDIWELPDLTLTMRIHRPTGIVWHIVAPKRPGQDGWPQEHEVWWHSSATYRDRHKSFDACLRDAVSRGWVSEAVAAKYLEDLSP